MATSNRPVTTSSWGNLLEWALDRRPALVLTSVAIASSLSSIAVIYTSQYLHRTKRRADLDERVRKAISADKNRDSTASSVPRYMSSSSLPGSPSAAGPSGLPTRRTDYDEELIKEQLSRNYSFLGDEGMTKIRESYVVVVGAGGVGSWAALMLIRSGVSHLKIIDFDQVSLSSLNRHACADLADVGKPKVVVCAEKFARIAPWAQIEPCVELFRDTSAAHLLSPSTGPSGVSREPDFVVDAIDNVDTKVELLRFCYERRLRCFSSMGAGGKSDASRIQIGDITSTHEDPLARNVRRKLRALGIPPIPPKQEKSTGRGIGGSGGSKTKSSKPDESSSNGDARGREQDKVQPNLAKGATPLQKTSTSKGAAVSKPSVKFDATTVADRNASRSAQPPPPSRSASQAALISSNAEPPRDMPSHSRRASSVSSVGSAAYSTPLTSPIASPKNERDMPLLSSLDDVMRQGSMEFGRDEVRKTDLEIQRYDLIHAGGLDGKEGEEKDITALLPDVGGEEVENAEAQNSHESDDQEEEVRELVPEDVASEMVNRPASSVDEDGDADNGDGQGPWSTYLIPCVYTTEISDTRLLPLDQDEFEKGNVNELSALEDFRVRILPVLGPLPGMFGLAAATYIICELAGRQQEPLPHKGRRRIYDKLHKDLHYTELKYPYVDPSPSGVSRKKPSTNASAANNKSKINSRAGGSMDTPSFKLPFLLNDIVYLYEEVFRCRTVVPPFEALNTPKFCRWDPSLPLSFNNIALFSTAQAKVHEREVLATGTSPFEVWGDETARMVRRRLEDERRVGVWRM